MKNTMTVLRKRKGIETAEEMAEKLGMSVWTYRNYESGKTPLTLDLAWRIADILDCSIDEVGGYIASPEEDSANTHNNLKDARLRSGLSQEELAQRFGSTVATIANYENGRRLPSSDKLLRLGEILGCSVGYLLGVEEWDEQDPNYIDVPLYGSIAAGEPIEMIPTDDSHSIPVSVHKKYPKAFLLEVKGESMNKVLPNGSYALIEPCSDVDRDGKPYAVCVNGYDATIKRVRRLENGFELVPDSTDPTFHAEVFDYSVEGTKTITIIGRVVWYTVPYDWSF